MLIVWYCFCMLCCPAGARLVAQSESYQYTHLTTQNGLSQSYVYCILQDHRGFMWFGTRNALLRVSSRRTLFLCEDYSGDIFFGTNSLFRLLRGGTIDVIPTQSASNLREGSELLSVLVDAHHSIWVGTTDGIVRIVRSRNAFRYLPYQDGGFRPVNVRALVEDTGGDIWAGTVSKCIVHVNRKVLLLEQADRWPRPRIPCLPEKTYINCAIRTRPGDILFGHGVGVLSAHFDAKSISRIGYSGRTQVKRYGGVSFRSAKIRAGISGEA